MDSPLEKTLDHYKQNQKKYIICSLTAVFTDVSTVVYGSKTVYCPLAAQAAKSQPNQKTLPLDESVKPSCIPANLLLFGELSFRGGRLPFICMLCRLELRKHNKIKCTIILYF